MNSRILMFSQPLLENLGVEILNALKECAKSCHYHVQTLCDFDTLVETKSTNNDLFLLLDPVTLVSVFENTNLDADAKTLIVALEKENPVLTNYTDRLTNLRYVIGKSSAQLMAGSLAAILEFHITNALRGVLPRILSFDLLKSFNLELTNTKDKEIAIESVVQFFDEELTKHKENFVAGTSGFPKNLSYIADELLMNSIWDAATNRAESNRSEALELPLGHRVQLECASDGKFLILSVTDQHGTFPEKAMLKPLRHALGLKVETKINQGTGGAGLGLNMILQKIHLLCYEMQKGRLTRAIALLRTDLSLRELQKLPKIVLFLEVQ